MADPRLFLDAEMAAAEAFDSCGGRVVVFTTRAPDKAPPGEDGALILPAGNGRGLLAVADGMGGGRAGDAASRIALESLAASRDALADGDGGMTEVILQAADRANDEIRALGLGAATTLVVAALSGDTVRPYHVGDSQLLIVGQRGKVKRVTVSHSPVSYAVEAGVLDADAALHHDDRHLVSNVVGADDMRLEIGSPLRLRPRDTLLLGTDGVFDNLRLEEIVEIVRCGPLGASAEKLRARCLRRMTEPKADQPSKPDDLTFVLYRRTGTA